MQHFCEQIVLKHKAVNNFNISSEKGERKFNFVPLIFDLFLNIILDSCKPSIVRQLYGDK